MTSSLEQGIATNLNYIVQTQQPNDNWALTQSWKDVVTRSVR
jgi:hypothetical protein